MTNKKSRKEIAPLIVLPIDTDESTLIRVRDAGYVAVLSDDPDKVKVVLGSSDISGSDILMSALHGIVKSGYSAPKEKFAEELYSRLITKESKRQRHKPNL